MVGILIIYILIQSIFEKEVFQNYWYYIKEIIIKIKERF